MAQKIERDIDKDKILERYLNLVYLGSGAYGVADAAWVYFSKPVKDLTLPEMAMLAGLPSAPSDYSPLVNEKVAKERRDTVLLRMQDSGYITPAQADDAIATPLTTQRSNPQRLERKATYFTEYIQQELPNYVSKEVLAQKGLTVETTLNLDWQAAAEEAVKETVERNGRYQRFEQAAMVAIDPRNGQIKTMVGGKDFYNQQFNRVTQAQRQPGSTFKTLVYTTALAAGFSPFRGYLDAPFTVRGYTPKNYSENFRGWINLKDALTSSINIVAVKTLIDVGWDPIIEVAKKMGIESELKPTYSLALGASEVNLLELTSAYGTLAAEGVHTKPHGIHRILDGRGKVIYQEKFKGERALDEESAAIMTWMLRSVVTDGTGRAAQLDRPVAGKTGTSDEARDLWFIGYIPQMVAGVWLGNDDNKPTYGASGTAAYTWHQFMAKVVKNMEVEKFPARPSQVEGRKGIIEAKPIRGRRAFNINSDSSERRSESRRSENRAESDSSRSRSDSDSSRSDSSRSRRVYSSNLSSGSSSNSRSAVSENSSTEDRPVKRRRRRRSSTTSQPDIKSNSTTQAEQPTRRRSRRRRSNSSENQVQQATEQQPVKRRSRRRRSSVESTNSSNNTTPSNSRRRRSSRRNSESSNSEPRQSPSRRRTSRPSPPAPSVQRRYEPAPAAPPPAPPAARIDPAPPPEAPAPRRSAE
jgi:penicillin-binding protein 1A